MLRNRLNAVQTLALTGDIYCFAADLITAFEAAKTSLGVLDYDDLIVYTNRLLSSRSVTQWDGSKSTAALNIFWWMKPKIPAHPMAGHCRFGGGVFCRYRPCRATNCLAVGDEKQSIYSFQGVDPGFEKCEQYFSESECRGVR